MTIPISECLKEINPSLYILLNRMQKKYRLYWASCFLLKYTDCLAKYIKYYDADFRKKVIAHCTVNPNSIFTLFLDEATPSEKMLHAAFATTGFLRIDTPLLCEYMRKFIRLPECDIYDFVLVE